MTLLAGDGSDYDYSALSCTSDTSLNGPPIQEREALKGVYYKRAQQLSPTDSNITDVLYPDDNGNLLSCGQRLHVIINVGGLRYQLPWTTLEDFPLSRLGQLRLCSSFDEIMRVCDDYDVIHNEFFFDRSPCAFQTILTFLRAGKLRSLREMCALSFREELLYWGVPEESLEWCCRRRLLQRVEECNELERVAEEDDEDDSQSSLARESRLSHWMGKLRDMVEKPHSPAGQDLRCLSGPVRHNNSHQPVHKHHACHEGGGGDDRSKLAFLRRPLNLIDVIAILPYYITLVVDSTSTGEKRLGSGSSYLDKVGLVLRVLRALRILYVMRLARHSLGLQTLGLTARRCTREFGLLLLFLCVAIALFSPLLYLIENEAGVTREFSSIPATYWWAVITMTTVGYGDMVPRSIPGQVVALSSILSGILLMAFPVTSIFHTFSRSYVELKQEQQRLLQRRTHFLLRSRIAGLGSNLSLESNMLFPSVSSDHRNREE
ncbi:hypothetical protein cypCar_00023005 [Cyprinus carpio]|nr:hypothetical protein cypCar_00023005 [Cyprinus carpio]